MFIIYQEILIRGLLLVSMKIALQVDKDLVIAYSDTTELPDQIYEFMLGFLEFMTQEIIQRIHKVVKDQIYRWDPLTDPYKKWKKKWNQDPRIWLASEQTLNSVTYWWSPLQDAWVIGVHPRTLHRAYKRTGGVDYSKKTRTRIMDIIKWMELGTQKMPARPLFTPVFLEYESQAMQQRVYKRYLKWYKTQNRA